MLLQRSQVAIRRDHPGCYVRKVTFDTTVTLTGPWRRPAQMLAEQSYDGHSSVHDATTAASLGLAGAPIEAPTHFSQFDPLCYLMWGRSWFEEGCISCHFQTMVVEGEEVQATVTTSGGTSADLEAHKLDGTSVLRGTASKGPAAAPSELTRRLSGLGDPGELFVLDQLEVGMAERGVVVSVDFDSPNGDGYPFSLTDKLERITESHPWYLRERVSDSPWGEAVLPMEMISVLSNKVGAQWPIRRPSLGLFLDLEVRLIEGPIFVGRSYELSREIIGIGQSRRTESYWTKTTLTDIHSGRVAAEVLLHSGVFKQSYPGYPPDRL